MRRTLQRPGRTTLKSVLLNYATPDYAGYQAINSLTGERAGFDECFAYGPSDIEASFATDHARILGESRGAGYWLWKPYFVARTLSELGAGDFLCYADAGTHFVQSIAPMLEWMETAELDLLILAEGFVEAQYTKRDAFVLMQADDARFTCTPQRFASCFLLRKSPRSVALVDRYLSYACDARIITDAPNACGLPNFPEFIAHRHDQSILSLLTKQAGLPVAPAGWLADGMPATTTQIVNHTRASFSAADIVRALLSRGVIRFADLARLA